MFDKHKNQPQDVFPPQPKSTAPLEHSTMSESSTKPADNTFERDEAFFGHHKPVTHDQDTIKNRFAHIKSWLKGLSKKQKILLISVIVGGILLTAGATWWFVIRAQPSPPAPAVIEEPVEEEPEPTIVPSKLTGLPVKPPVNETQVTGVMIENSPDARPQSGLQQAGVVFEAIAESGITRFLALYQDTSSDHVGPIRSVRPYYLDFLMPFDATVAHVGGSPHALAQIPGLGVKTIGQFQDPGAYERVSTRYAPHNMYSSVPKLKAVEKQRKYTKSDYNGFARKESENPRAEPTAKTIDLRFSSELYNVQYKYSTKDNHYSRSMAGRPHVDERTNRQIAPKVVVALVMNRSVMANGIHTVYGTTGSGKMFVFQDGGVVEGTWKKSSRKAQFSFTDKNGKEIELTPGKTWVGILDAANAVNYKP